LPEKLRHGRRPSEKGQHHKQQCDERHNPDSAFLGRFLSILTGVKQTLKVLEDAHTQRKTQHLPPGLREPPTQALSIPTTLPISPLGPHRGSPCHPGPPLASDPDRNTIFPVPFVRSDVPSQYSGLNMVAVKRSGCFYQPEPVSGDPKCRPRGKVVVNGDNPDLPPSTKGCLRVGARRLSEVSIRTAKGSSLSIEKKHDWV